MIRWPSRPKAKPARAIKLLGSVAATVELLQAVAGIIQAIDR